MLKTSSELKRDRDARRDHPGTRTLAMMAKQWAQFHSSQTKHVSVEFLVSEGKRGPIPTGGRFI